MCFFYAIIKKRADNLKKHKVVNEEQLSLFEDFFLINGFDHEQLPVILDEKPGEIQMIHWGLIPSWTRSKEETKKIRTYTLNAKSETLFEKPSFKKSIKEKRCLVLCSGFYEWHTKKVKGKTQKYPFYISMKDDEIFTFAGIWDEWTDKDTGEIIRTFSIITTEANELVKKIHNIKKRMPVIIEPKKANEWLKKELSTEEIKTFLKTFDTKRMKAHSISKLITSKTEDPNVPQVQAYFNYPELVEILENKGIIFE